MGVTLFMHQSMLSPRVEGRTYPGGFDILGHFHAKFFTQGEKTLSDVKYPFPWGTFCLILDDI